MREATEIRDLGRQREIHRVIDDENLLGGRLVGARGLLILGFLVADLASLSLETAISLRMKVAATEETD